MALCHTFTFGGAWNKYRSSCINTALLHLLGHTSASRAGCSTDLAKCVSAVGDFLQPQGAVPPGFYPLGWGLLPGAWGIPTGPKVFGHAVRMWALALCPDPPKKKKKKKKKALCHTCTFGEVCNKYRSSCSKHLACLHVRWTKETLLGDLDTFVWHLISLCWVIYLLTPNNRS